MVSAEGPPYKMSTLDTDINQHFQDAIDVIQHHSDSSYCDPGYKYYETLGSQQPLGCHISCYLVTPGHADSLGPVYDWSSAPLGGSAPLGSQPLQSSSAQQPWHLGAPDVSVGQPVPLEASPFYPVLPIPRNGKGRKKLRLYEYLHEALSDPAMADSIQWTDTANGTFHFVSKNKERLAECWGQRKGNRKTMTYQKMARALRNYSRSGEIIKVRRKLTYQFNPVILQRLGGAEQGLQQLRSPVSPSVPGLGPQGAPTEPGCYGPDWYSWYGHYPLQEQWFSGQDPRHL